MKEVLKRGFTSFALSSFAGLIVNLIIDIIMNARGLEGFSSMSPDYVALFPSVTIAAYVNILLYGVIGATFCSVYLYLRSRENRIHYPEHNLLCYHIISMRLHYHFVMAAPQVPGGIYLNAGRISCDTHHHDGHRIQKAQSRYQGDQ